MLDKKTSVKKMIVSFLDFLFFRFDSNNVVLIEENGNPSGTRITAPLPNMIRPILKRDSNPKKADYTKLLAIASNWI